MARGYYWAVQAQNISTAAGSSIREEALTDRGPGVSENLQVTNIPASLIPPEKVSLCLEFSGESQSFSYVR